MVDQSMVMYEDEFKLVDGELQKLKQQANATFVFLVDKNGQLIASAGDTKNVDTTALASLTAGNIAATGGIAQLLGEKEFTVLFHEGEKDNINISLIGDRIILAVIFGSEASIGLVRLRVKKASEILTAIFEDITSKAKNDHAAAGGDSPFADISEEDIDNLFN